MGPWDVVAEHGCSSAHPTFNVGCPGLSLTLQVCKTVGIALGGTHCPNPQLSLTLQMNSEYL